MLPDRSVIDLPLLNHARRLLETLYERHGVRWFIDPTGKRLMALDPDKVDLVVRMALKARGRAGSELSANEASVVRCRQQVRRELIARVAREMVATGC